MARTFSGVDDITIRLCDELEDELGRELTEDERVFVDCCFDTEEMIHHSSVGLHEAIERWDEATS